MTSLEHKERLCMAAEHLAQALEAFKDTACALHGKPGSIYGGRSCQEDWPFNDLCPGCMARAALDEAGFDTVSPLA